ncbi:MAG: alpha/beta hydrolase [Acidimicrobiales bacterium]
MPVDPEIQVLLDLQAQSGFEGIASVAPDAAGVRAFMRQMRVPVAVEEVAAVEDLVCPGPAGAVGLRLYRPSGAPGLPILVWFHGGGWTIGDIETSDGTCRALANASGVAVISVEYRLAPEHPFPAAVEDCWAALRWVVAHATELGLDSGRLALGGDSAGGNLAAVASLLARGAGGPAIRFQLLVYPATDGRLKWPSLSENAKGYFMTSDDVEWFYQQYAPPDREDWRMSPLLAADHSRLPPALVITAEFDPLRDEGEAYADALGRAGVASRLIRYDGMIHGFFGMHATVDVARRAVDEAGAAVRAALA